jgi:protein SCO1/2
VRLSDRKWARLLSFVSLLGLTFGCRAFTENTLPVLDIGGDFVLTDYNEAQFDLRSLRGKVVLIFFGYSFCPDACPITLSKLSSVSRKLGNDRAHVKTLYISVDPQRDTPAVLKADLANFDLDAVGLTGTKTEIDKVVAQYGAAYEIVPTPGSAAPYAVGHTTWLYALDRNGRVRIRFDYEATVDEIVQGIKAILSDAAAPSSPEDDR